MASSSVQNSHVAFGRLLILVPARFSLILSDMITAASRLSGRLPELLGDHPDFSHQHQA